MQDEASIKSLIVIYTATLLNKSNSYIIKNANKIKLCDVLDAEILSDSPFSYELWKKLQLKNNESV